MTAMPSKETKSVTATALAPPGQGTPNTRTVLGIIALSTFLSMSVWFSASFVVPQLTSLWHLSAGETSLLTIGVQVGFVVGAIALAATGLADTIPTRRLMSLGSIGAAAANLGILWVPGLPAALTLRVVTGILLAAVYPPALKMVSTWFREGRGKALGFMIGALTLGSALPHLINASGGLNWRIVIGGTSVLSSLGGLLILMVRGNGPYPFPKSTFKFGAALTALRNRPVALANLGYIGHMWELYAMWAWVAAFFASLPAVAASSSPRALASLLAFVCIGGGTLGCMAGGYLSDRYGRAQSALISLACSGTAAVVVSLSRGLPLPVILGVCIFWGFWVIADSAQFSAIVTENADPRYVGSAVALQLAAGFLTTTVTLWLVPVLVEKYSWGPALAVLAIGPAIGVGAMIGLLRVSKVKQPSTAPMYRTAVREQP